VRTPPKHPDLQPIEWAYCKGNVARAYTTSTTFEIVGRRLRAEFDVNLDELVVKLIKKSQAAEVHQREADCGMYDDDNFQFDIDDDSDDEEDI